MVEADGTADVAVQLDQVPAAGAGVQAIDILGGEEEAGPCGLYPRESVVAGIRLGLGGEAAAPFVPFPHHARVALESLRRREVFRPVFGP